MIVVDENLHDHRILAAISARYSGQVVSVTSLRPGTVIKDEAIPDLLLKAAQPTFVTINAADFWRKIQPHAGYSIILVALPQEQVSELSNLLRRFFRLPNFKTKTARMGKVVLVTQSRIEYYESDRRVRSLIWPE